MQAGVTGEADAGASLRLMCRPPSRAPWPYTGCTPLSSSGVCAPVLWWLPLSEALPQLTHARLHADPVLDTKALLAWSKETAVLSFRVSRLAVLVSWRLCTKPYT